MPLGKYSKCTGYVVGGKQTLMEKGLNPKSLPSAILELLVFLWNSKSVVIAKPKRPNRILELQRTRSHLLSKQVSLHCAAWVFTFKSEDMSTVGQYGSDGFEFLYFSFVSNQHLCVYDQTPQKDFTSMDTEHVRTCRDCSYTACGCQRHLASTFLQFNHFRKCSMSPHQSSAPTSQVLNDGGCERVRAAKLHQMIILGKGMFSDSVQVQVELTLFLNALPTCLCLINLLI